MNPDQSLLRGDLAFDRLQRVVGLCDRFDAAQRDGSAPRIEDYLAEAPAEEVPVLLRELVSLELEYLAERGTEPPRDVYHRRFPAHEGVIDAAFAEVELGTLGSRGSLRSYPTTTIAGLPDRHSETVSGETPLSTPDAEYHPIEPAQAPAPQGLGAIGRFRLERLLGEGGFGRVYEAYDTELDRRVALKVPHSARMPTARETEAYRAEAQMLARLDHAGIVPVYDVGQAGDGCFYIVSKLIDGRDLAGELKQRRPGHVESAALVAAVAEALQHAHSRGLVHRDVKARNILIDREGRPYLTDFGLALREEDLGKGPAFAGTPVYMSPEQARGEGHLVDGRSDIFSLGVVFYEMLTGTRPFKGETWQETLERIKTLDVRPPRQVVDSIPRELERICLKALAKRPSERYATALEMSDDLRHALAQGGRPSTAGPGSAGPAAAGGTDIDLSTIAQPIVPKGLRSFDADDADFFVRLVPGPRDREGIPESLRFWKQRIESSDAARSFRVGLVYGPSGCGKSSFVQAGLLPRLDGAISTAFLAATPDDTEPRLAAALRRRLPDLPAEPLPALLAAIRRGQGVGKGQKVLIVLDQFEQWLHAHRAAEDPELVQALRQCDGTRLQCLLVVRDDFWMSVTRFMQQLEVRLVEGVNSAAVDLFDLRHARKVLTAYGRAFEALPSFPNEPRKDQAAFIDQAVAGLARDGKVVCVQLSLFAEMVKSRAWTPATLRAVGGTQGVGVAFLDETFAAATAPPEHRRHQEAARAVLRALLPEQGSEIKGHLRARRILLDASGYAASPRDFDELIRILDNELRLITPVDPPETGEEAEAAAAAAGTNQDGHEPLYQLTHDYLVPALRDWLTKKQRETRRGRAEIRLADRTALWSARPEKKQLPSLLEWLDIRLYTRRRHWSAREHEMMSAGTRHHAVRVVHTLLLLLAVGLVGAEGYGRLRSGALVDRLLAAETVRLPEIIAQLGPYRRWVDPRLRAEKERARPDSTEALHASLALLPVDRGQARDLARRLLEADLDTVGVIREALAPEAGQVRDELWKNVEAVYEPHHHRLRAACALARYDPASPRWPAVATDLVSMLTGEDLFSVPQWSELLQPMRKALIPPFRSAFHRERDKGRESQRGAVAAAFLAAYTADQPHILADLIQESDERQLRILLSRPDPRHQPALIARLEKVLKLTSPAGDDDQRRDALARRQANAALALTVFDRAAIVWPLFEFHPDPRLRSYLIARLPSFETDPIKLVMRLRTERDPAIREALAMALGSFDDNALPKGMRNALGPEMLARYRDEVDPGVHSSLGWLLRRWSLDDQLRAADAELARRPPRPGQRWRVNSEGHTLVAIPGPVEFIMGSPPEEIDREPLWGEKRGLFDETQHTRRIPRSYEIATTEVTVEQFLRSPFAHDYNKAISPDPHCPMNQATFYDVAKYCRWLSEQEGIPEDQMCYPPYDQIKPGFSLPPDYLSRTGYRLPTEAEWEFACRAGTTTSRYYGFDIGLLGRYGWSFYDSPDVMPPVGGLLPNRFGLFDMLGNAYERCLGPDPRIVAYPKGPVDDVEANVGLPPTLVDDTFLVIRGGAHHRHEALMRSAGRSGDGVGDANVNVGFRIARTIK